MAEAIVQAQLEISADKGEEKGERKRFGWFWPVGLAATSLAGLAVVAFRGCWHKRMSWPVRMQNHSYQVCLSCGVKRLFDEKRFCSYGPYRYDLNELIAWEKSHEPETIGVRRAERPAS